MTKHEADDATDEFRAATSEDLQLAIVRTPEDFGMQFLSVDELIDQAESTQVDGLADRHSKRNRMAAGASLAAAAVVTVAVVVPRLGDDASRPIAVPPGPTASSSATPATYDTARAVLLAAAAVKGPSTSDIRYWYVKSVLHVVGEPDAQREIWLGNGRPSIVQEYGFVDRLPASAIAVAGRRFAWSGVQNLPADVVALRRLLGSDPDPKSQDNGWNTFYAAGELIAEAPLPPQTRSAVWRVLAGTPGAQRTDRTTDAIGRAGWTVSKASEDEGTLTYVVDPESGQLLELRRSAVGTRPAWSVTYVQRGPADSAPLVDRG